MAARSTLVEDFEHTCKSLVRWCMSELVLTGGLLMFDPLPISLLSGRPASVTRTVDFELFFDTVDEQDHPCFTEVCAAIPSFERYSLMACLITDLLGSDRPHIQQKKSGSMTRLARFYPFAVSFPHLFPMMLLL